MAVFEIGIAFGMSYRAVEKILGRPSSPAPYEQGSLFAP
jgi:hypothetical protein